MKIKKILTAALCIATLLQAVAMPAGAAEIGKTNILSGKTIVSNGFTHGMGEWNLCDGRSDTLFSSVDNNPEVIVDLGGSYIIGAVEFTARFDMDQSGLHQNLKVYGSDYEDFRTADLLVNTGDKGFPAYSTHKVEVSSNKSYKFLKLARDAYMCLGDFAAYEKILSEEELASMEIVYNDIEDGTDLSNKISLISALGAKPAPIEGNFSADAEISRAEFAKLLCSILDYPAHGVSVNKLSDTKDASGEKETELLYTMGIVDAYVADMFKPNLTITTDDALVWVAKALGYGGIGLESKADFVTKAAEIKLLKNVNKTEKLTRKDAVYILYNMLYAEALEIKSIKGSSVKYGKTTLLEARGVTEKKGVFEETPAKSIIKNESTIVEGKVIVDGGVYVMNKERFLDFLGSSIKYWYTYDEASGDNRIIFMEKSNKQTEVYVEAQKLTDFDEAAHIIRYEDESGNEKKIRFRNSTKILYNGRLIGNNVDDAHLLPSEGNVTFIDYEGDGSFDYIYIFSYDDKIVQRVNAAEGVIFFEDGKGMIDLEDKKAEFYIDGSLVDINAVGAGAVASVGESVDGGYYIVYLSGDAVEGKFTKYNQPAEGRTKIQLNYHEEYPLSANFYGDLISEFEERGVAYINYEGYVVKFDTEGLSRHTYGIITDLYVSSGIADKGEIAIYTKDAKVSVYEITEDTVVDRERSTTLVEVERKIRDAVTDGDGNIYDGRALVKYLLTVDGVVKEIDTTAVSPAEAEESNFHLMTTVPSGGTYYVNGIFEGSVITTYDTIIFKTYGDSDDPEKRYDIGTMGSDIEMITNVRQNHKNLAFYGEDRTDPTPVVLWTTSTGAGVGEDTPIILIDKVIQGINVEGETVPVICGMYQGEYRQLPLKSRNVLIYTSAGNQNLYTISNSILGRGDVIRVNVDRNGEVAGARYEFDYNDEGNAIVKRTTPRPITAYMNQWFVAYGGVYEVKNNFIMFKAGYDMEAATYDFDIMRYNFPNVYICDMTARASAKATENSKLDKIITYQDALSAGIDHSNIFIRVGGGEEAELVIYVE